MAAEHLCPLGEPARICLCCAEMGIRRLGYEASRPFTKYLLLSKLSLGIAKTIHIPYPIHQPSERLEFRRRAIPVGVHGH